MRRLVRPTNPEFSTMLRKSGITRFIGNSLRAKGGGEPPAALKQKIEAAFGSVDACKKELSAAAVAQFGSGWAWLVAEGEKLKVLKTGDAETPITQNSRPLFTIDVWEHAY